MVDIKYHKYYFIDVNKYNCPKKKTLVGITPIVVSSINGNKLTMKHINSIKHTLTLINTNLKKSAM